jgi:hypothetical protein
MITFACPYLGHDVELTDERAHHILAQHPELQPGYEVYLRDTLSDPEQVRTSPRFGNARRFSRWFESLRGGKFVVVVVVSEPSPAERHWIITAYVARKLAPGVIEWQRP